MKAVVIMIPLLNFALKGAFLDLVAFLFVFLFFLDLVDNWLGIKKARIQGNYSSEIGRAGLDTRASSYLTILAFSVMIYFVIGGVCGHGLDCKWICQALSAIPATFLALYILNTFSSIVENNIEIALARGIKPSKATIIFSKFLNLSFKRISNKLLKKIDDGIREKKIDE